MDLLTLAGALAVIERRENRDDRQHREKPGDHHFAARIEYGEGARVVLAESNGDVGQLGSVADYLAVAAPLTVGLFVLVMAPWWIRQLAVFGTLSPSQSASGSTGPGASGSRSKTATLFLRFFGSAT